MEIIIATIVRIKLMIILAKVHTIDMVITTIINSNSYSAIFWPKSYKTEIFGLGKNAYFRKKIYRGNNADYRNDYRGISGSGTNKTFQNTIKIIMIVLTSLR